MAAQSIFDLGPCAVTVQSQADAAEYHLGSMGYNDTQTFEDAARGGEVVTVAIDATGVVSLSRDTPWNDPGTTTDGYRVDLIPSVPPDDGATAWIQSFLFAQTSSDPQAAISGFITQNGDDNFSGAAAEDGTFSPDPTPAVTLTDANKPVQYDTTAAIQGGS